MQISLYCLSFAQEPIHGSGWFYEILKAILYLSGFSSIGSLVLYLSNVTRNVVGRTLGLHQKRGTVRREEFICINAIHRV